MQGFGFIYVHEESVSSSAARGRRGMPTAYRTPARATIGATPGTQPEGKASIFALRIFEEKSLARLRKKVASLLAFQEKVTSDYYRVPGWDHLRRVYPDVPPNCPWLRQFEASLSRL